MELSLIAVQLIMCNENEQSLAFLKCIQIHYYVCPLTCSSTFCSADWNLTYICMKQTPITKQERKRERECVKERKRERVKERREGEEIKSERERERVKERKSEREKE